MFLYSHNLTNPAHSLSVKSYRKFGLIEAKDDPGLVEGSPYFKGGSFSSEQREVLDRDAKDQASFEENYHLVKGWFRPEGQLEIDPQKENLIINYTEDSFLYLEPFLEDLNNYLRLETDKVQEIKNHFNIFITWSTSLLDTLKVLKRIKTELGEAWSKTYTLFLNDKEINTGTGPNHEGRGLTKEGKYILAEARKNLGIPVDKSRAIVQSNSFDLSYRLKIRKHTSDWAHYNEDKVLKEIDNLVEDFNSYPGGFEINKLYAANRLRIGTDVPLKKDMGCRIPIEAFIKWIDSQKTT